MLYSKIKRQHMETGPRQYFEHFFAKLTGRHPYPWQRKLFLEIVGGRWAQILSLPTGAGKTAVLHIRVLALAWRKTAIPRSADRGLIEASSPVARSVTVTSIPRSADRGLIEARLPSPAPPTLMEIPQDRVSLTLEGLCLPS